MGTALRSPQKPSPPSLATWSTRFPTVAPCDVVPFPGPHTRDVVARPGARPSSSSISGENTGQVSGNGNNEVPQAFKALDDSSVASEENFYDIDE